MASPWRISRIMHLPKWLIVSMALLLVIMDARSASIAIDFPRRLIDETVTYMENRVYIDPSHGDKACSNPDDDEEAAEDIDYGVPQKEHDEATQKVIAETVKYMENTVYVDAAYESVRSRCKNEHVDCAYWASVGECEKSSQYMNQHCTAACQTCDMLHVAKRCKWDPTKPQAWKHGDLNRMFERITADPDLIEKYSPTILSRPSENKDEDGPWIITLDNFISETECDYLIQAGKDVGYERSTGGSDKKGENGEYLSTVSEYRTSYQTWCMGECYESEAARNVSARIEHVTGIAEVHSEFFELLRYQPGQYYKVHGDFIDVQLERPMGPRLLTVFLYLNEPEEGGGTSFPKLGPLTVQPKRGRALIWPSVLNEDFSTPDTRTDHEALPVVAGEKYSVNAWLHLGDFKDAYARSCSFN